MSSKNIYIYYQNSNELFFLENNNIYNNNQHGILNNIKDIFYKITWFNNNANANKEEYFFTFDNINYYQDIESNTKLLNNKIKYINIKHCNWDDIFILNYKDYKIYKKNNYCEDGNIYIENNKLIVDWTNYGNEILYFSNYENIYYSISYINMYFKKIYIIENNQYFYYNIKNNYIYDIDLTNIIYNVNNKNENLILNNINNNNKLFSIIYYINDNIYTFDRKLYITYINNNNRIVYDIDDNKLMFHIFTNNILYNNKLYNYIIKKNNDIILDDYLVLKFYNEQNNILYYYDENTYNKKILLNNNLIFNELIKKDINTLKLNYHEEYNLNKNYNEYINQKKDFINNYRIDNIILFIIIHNKDLFDVLDKIDYLSTKYNYKIIIFENIINKYKYEKYYDYLNIIYYFNIDNTLNLFNNTINKNDIFYIYSNNTKYFIEKIINNKLIFYEIYDIQLFNDTLSINNNNTLSIDNNNTLSVVNNNTSINVYNKIVYSNMRDYYESKYKNILDLSKDIKNIPKIIHFIWIGDSEIPEKYLEYIETWLRYHPDYHFCFWNNNNIPKLINQELFDLATENAMKADILRYELIYFLGGIYIDCDFLCIKNIDDLIYNLDNFCSYESKEFITNAIFGFKKGHPFLYQIIKNLKYNFFIYKNVINNNLYIPKITGPEYFTLNCKIFKNINILDTEIFYSYTFLNKYNNNNIIIKKENYGIHLWGNSWNNKKKIVNNIDNNNNNNNIDNNNNNNNIDNNNIDNSDNNNNDNSDNNNDNSNNNNDNSYNNNIDNNVNNKLKLTYDKKLMFTNKIESINLTDNNVLYVKSKNKINIVHIIGIFFSGGIERLMYYFSKYGDYNKYNYIILCHGFSDKKYYNINNIISFDGNQYILNKYLHLINPSLIIDHYSIYIDNNIIMYNNINKNNVIQFMHTAILYKKDISFYNIKKCIHLYKEDNNIIHSSWNNILNNYYVTLGCEINNIKYKKIKDDKNKSDINKNKDDKRIIISIVGRIAEEKIPIDFLKELSTFSINNYKKFIINIYGEKDYLFSNEYIEKFDKIIYGSNIKYLNFINSDDIYKNTNILLIPSLYETGSFVCLEAFKYGIPVIARNCYGLKHLISNEITGFLYNNNEECFNIISSINKKKIKSMNEYIINESFKYNIVDKIKDIELIINNNIPTKNIFIITSILNCTNAELSYCKKRTVFSFKSRLRQTIKTIQSIRKYYNNCDILLCDCSDLSNYKEEELIIKNMVNFYYNFYDNHLIKDAVNGKYKGYGECMILLNALNIINNLSETYKYIFKISGRYYLNDNFDNNIFENNENVFTTWDGCNFSLCTVLYKLMYNDRKYFENILRTSINELLENNSIEICIYKYFLKNINIVDKINVDGYLSTEGYYCSF